MPKRPPKPPVAATTPTGMPAKGGKGAMKGHKTGKGAIKSSNGKVGGMGGC